MNKYNTFLKLGIAGVLEYRMDFLIELLNSLFPIIVQYFVWTAIYLNSTQTIINGYSYKELISYIFIATLMSKAIAPGFENEIATEIRTGKLNTYLIKPMSYYLSKIYSTIGKKIIHMAIICPIMLICYYVILNYWGMPVEPRNILFFMITLIVAFLLNCCIFYALSMVTFWTTQSWGIIIAFQIVINILSGGVLPLNVIGTYISNIFRYLPFRYIIEFPVEVLQGNYSISGVFIGIAIQIVSIGFFIILSTVLWKKGLKHYDAFGG